MIDIKLMRETPEIVRENLKKRHDKEKLKLLDELLEEDKKWRKVIVEINELRAKRNKLSEEISALKKQKKGVTKLLEEARKIPDKIKKLENELSKHEEKVKDALLRIPNILHDTVPIGKDENDNVEIRRWGKEPKFGFEPKNHLEILQNLGMIDEERGAKIAGRGFYFLKGNAVLLDLALQRFAIDTLLKKGFTLVEPPFMINRNAYEGVIDPTDFEMVTYKVENEDLYLIATSEHPMGAMFSNEVLDKNDLPIKLCGISPCFRKEVGTHGKYTKGLFRMHHFNKVEQFVFCLPEQSWTILENLQRNSEEIFQKLGLHHRVVSLCSGDTGKVQAKTYDLEIWMADGKFREVGSNSNCTDYQARRLNIKFREKEGQAPVGFVHTLNNTAIATSRTMIAIIEQFQQKDGSVIIPEVLRPYMNGLERLEKK